MTTSSDKKTYIGHGREISGKYGPFIALTLFKSDIDKLLELAQTTDRPVRININRRREVSPKGYTHYGLVDKWAPPERQDHPDYDGPQDRANPPPSDMDDNEDLPF